jgi:hypothetical protein
MGVTPTFIPKISTFKTILSFHARTIEDKKQLPSLGRVSLRLLCIVYGCEKSPPVRTNLVGRHMRFPSRVV